LAVAGDRTADETRIGIAQARHGEAEFADGSGFKVLHKHIGLRQHGLEQRLVLGFAEIEHNRLLAAIEPDEIGAFAMDNMIVIAREIALGPFDLDHSRARIGKTASTLRRRHRLFYRNNEEPFERKRHLNTTLADRERARPGTIRSCWSRLERPDRAASRETSARRRIPQQNRIRRGSERTWRRRPEAWPYWLPRRYLRPRHICARPRAPSVRQRASVHKRARSETAHPGSGRSGGRTVRVPWHTDLPWR